ncbi:MAG: biotin--[acetyl-CoA-carboxylase] ligase [Bacteroidales bacterium]|nr:biotin--[acetyl-CoA-carboxylase] ligase [Bacteroidales bacterium]
MKIEKFDSLESTNKYCEALDLNQVEDFTCYWALTQTAGIGQRGNHWEAAPGMNLTFSLVLHPTFLPADRQFKLTEALSLALVDFLSPLTSHLSPSIKWPNDIYVDGHKICGTLVSARLVGNSIASAICGIGLNVNQRMFPDWVPHPTSLALLTDKQYELEPLLQQLLACIERRYNELKNGKDSEGEYLSHLLNLGVPAHYKYKEEKVEATITGVDPHGHLLLTTTDGRRLCCGMKEIALLM